MTHYGGFLGGECGSNFAAAQSSRLCVVGELFCVLGLCYSLFFQWLSHDRRETFGLDCFIRRNLFFDIILSFLDLSPTKTSL